MEQDGIFRRGIVAVALLRHHVQQHRALDLLGHGQILLQLPDAVAVDGAVVVEPQFLEEHAAHQAGLDGVFDLVQEPLHRIADHRHPGEHLLHFRLDARIERVHPHAIQRLGQAADPRADRHLVVVEHDDQVLLQAAGVVQCLQDDAGTEGPVADDRHGSSGSSSGRSRSSAQRMPRTQLVAQPAWPVRNRS